MSNNKLSSVDWFKSLDVNTRINAKSIFVLLTGVCFEDLNCLFTYTEKIEIMYQKLIIEEYL